MLSVNDVTIIIPSYCTNTQSVVWLQEAIQSAQAQGCKVVLVDDASPLQSEVHDMLSQIMRQGYDDAMALNYHMGVSAARNFAASRVTTQLLYPLDGDDLLVDNAVAQLLAMWNGVPVYSDIEKFTDSKSIPYPLLDFTCDLAYEKIGIASVNVLHSVAQHKFIGGWNETLNFYEDGEYNARLMLCNGAVKLPRMLVRYRQHEGQRTNTYKRQHAMYAKTVFDMIRRFDTNMCAGGCGKYKRADKAQSGNVAAKNTNNRAQMIASLPGESADGKVLARYVGGVGRGWHYSRGKYTKYPYKVKHNEVLHVDPRDTVADESQAGVSPFIRIGQPEQPAQQIVQVVEQQKQVKKRTPRKDVVKTPVLGDVVEVEPSLPDLQTLTQTEALLSLEDISPEEAQELLDIEREGKNRAKVVKKLQRRIKSSGDDV